jgi:iron(III) transport system substrate-binding protein
MDSLERLPEHSMRLDPRFSRRRLMRTMAGGALVFGAIPVLGACTTSSNRSSDDDAAATEPASDDSTDDTAVEEADDAGSADDSASMNGDSIGGQVTVYSGRGQDLVQPILDRFAEETGIEVRVRYGDTAEMAAAILEEGQNTPADVYYGQDAGALGALALEGMARKIPDSTLDLVDSRFKSPDGLWVGSSGRARTVIYDTDQLDESDLPTSIVDYADPQWENMLGWAPTNGSFQAWVTALRVLEGEDVAREWLEDIQALNPLVYEGNNPIVQAAMAGEVAAGFVNHYYLYRFEAEAGGEVGANNYFFRDGDIGGLINVAGMAILEPSRNVEQAEMLVDFLLQQEAQEYFAGETYEYPLAAGFEPAADIPGLDELETPDIDLSNLEDLEGTLALLQEVGLL